MSANSLVLTTYCIGEWHSFQIIQMGPAEAQERVTSVTNKQTKKTSGALTQDLQSNCKFVNYSVIKRKRIATSEKNPTHCVRHCQGSEKNFSTNVWGNKL